MLALGTVGRRGEEVRGDEDEAVVGLGASRGTLCTSHSFILKKKAERLLNSVAKMTAGGTPLGDALKLLGLNEQRYNKIRLKFDL